MNSPVTPTLAPPGAGLPTPELWIARVLFGLKQRFGTREGFTSRFEQERAAIHEMLATCDPARRGETGAHPATFAVWRTAAASGPSG